MKFYKCVSVRNHGPIAKIKTTDGSVKLLIFLLFYLNVLSSCEEERELCMAAVTKGDLESSR